VLSPRPIIDEWFKKRQFALRVVPLPDFTVYNIKQEETTFLKLIFNIFCFVFLPRWYKINRKEKYKLSPFSRMAKYADSDDMFDNPAIEAVIDFRWKTTRIFFLLRSFLFLIYGVCFGYISWEYINHSKGSLNFLVVSIVIFYYLAIYQFAAEMMQLHYRGFKRYFGNLLNRFDLYSIIIPVTVMLIILKNEFRLSNGFGSVEKVNFQYIAWISISIFIIWIEAVSIILLHGNPLKIVNILIS